MGNERLSPAEKAMADPLFPSSIRTRAFGRGVNDPGRDPDRSFATLCRFHMACHRQATCAVLPPVVMIATVLLKAPSVIRDAARARRLLRIIISCLPSFLPCRAGLPWQVPSIGMAALHPQPALESS